MDPFLTTGSFPHWLLEDLRDVVLECLLRLLHFHGGFFVFLQELHFSRRHAVVQWRIPADLHDLILDHTLSPKGVTCLKYFLLFLRR